MLSGNSSLGWRRIIRCICKYLELSLLGFSKKMRMGKKIMAWGKNDNYLRRLQGRSLLSESLIFIILGKIQTDWHSPSVLGSKRKSPQCTALKMGEEQPNRGGNSAVGGESDLRWLSGSWLTTEAKWQGVQILSSSRLTLFYFSSNNKIFPQSVFIVTLSIRMRTRKSCRG